MRIIMTQWKVTRDVVEAAAGRNEKRRGEKYMCEMKARTRGADEEERSSAAAEEDQLGQVYRPDSDRGTACESSGRQRCAGVRAPRVRGSASAK